MSYQRDFPPTTTHRDADGDDDEDVKEDTYRGGQAAAPLEDEDDDAYNEVTLSFVTDGPRICFAAYNEASREIWIEECLADGYEVAAVVERVILLLQPTLILVSKKIVTNQKLLALLTTLATDASDSNGDNYQDDTNAVASRDNGEQQQQQQRDVTPPQSRSIPYQALKSSTFDVRNCKALILQKLMVQSITRQAQGRSWRDPGRRFAGSAPAPHFAVSRYHALASVVDLESTVQLQALGSLLSYLNRTLFPTAEGGYVVVKDIVHGNLSLYMNVSSATLSALHIFATERHPLLAAKGTGNAKEGFSLFSLMDNTKSRVGRQRLREWMLKPLVDLESIVRRQDGVELFLLPDFQDAVGTILVLLERIGSVDQIIRRMEKCVTQAQDFVILVRSIKAALQICETLQQDIMWSLQNTSANDDVGHYIAFVQELIQRCAPVALQELSQKLAAAVDETATSQWGSSIVIRDGYSQELDVLRDQYHQLSDILQDICCDLALQLPHLSPYIDLAFLPQIGFLVRLRDDERWEAEGALPEDFDFIYSEGGVTCFKNHTVRGLDMQYGDLDAKIKDKESLLVAELEDEIMTYTIDLQQTFGALADLDCILSFANLAGDCGFVRPQIVPAEKNCILIRNGRHPLQEMLLGKDFVPNDTVVNDENRVNIITGPNFSGKSCYARQVGVLIYMAHTGCFIPCDAARISIVREILVRFSALETCAVPQSTFQLDLSQMGSILRLAGPGSLVLIDEFGKGTSPASGIALLASAIQYLTESQAKVICTTHFVETFSMGMLEDGKNGVKALQMAVKIPERSSDIAVPLFKLEHGVADSSAGLVCARMAGLRSGIVERAGEVIQASRQGKPIAPLEEIFRANLTFSESELALLRHFIQRDWNQASESEIQELLDAIHRLR